MAKLVYGLNQTLDGYVDHTAFDPAPALFRHFIETTKRGSGSVYGRTMYEIMRYWDDEQPEWGPDEHEFAAAWRSTPKWVVSRTLSTGDLGPNATLVADDLEGLLRTLKAEKDGDIDIAGTILAQSATDLGVIDEYQIYLHPIVLGAGKPYFAGKAPPLRLAANEPIADGVIRLTYVPA